MSTIEMDELRTCFAKKCEELEKAQACAAEMRGILEHGVHFLSYEERLNHALSTSCGVGWLSPEKVKELEDILPSTFYSNLTLKERIQFMVDGWRRSVKACNEHDIQEYKLERENQIMWEALEKLKQITEKGAYLNPMPRTTIRDIVLEALAKLKGQ